jgi:hypothetical protein
VSISTERELYADLIAAERALADLERLLRARHPETLTPQNYHEMRRDFLKILASVRRLMRTTAENIDGRCNPQGDYRD